MTKTIKKYAIFKEYECIITRPGGITHVMLNSEPQNEIPF